MLRIRNCCPKCGSVVLQKRTRIGGYVCQNCLHEFEVPKKQMRKNVNMGVNKCT